jgi:putative cell wall-binding protein
LTSSLGSIRKKATGAALAAVLGFSGVAALVPGAANAAQTVTSERVAGTDRYGTASAIANKAYPGGSNSIVLASGEPVSATDNNSPDALAAATLAGALNAPILLTAKGSLPAVTASTMKGLDDLIAGPATVYVVGGTAAVSQAVRDEVKALGYTLNETSGTDRYKTAAAIATKAAGISTSTTFNGFRTAIVATGEGFADALSAGPVAFSQDMPILLTPSASLGTDASSTLTSLGVQQALIMGGTAAVSTAAEDAIKAKGISTVRFAGTNRNDTAAKLAATAIKTTGTGGFGFAGTHVYLASGLNFPDALAASPLAGGANAGTAPAGPILLTASLPAETSAFLTANKATITKVWGMGGTGVIPDADLTAATTAATLASPTATITAAQGTRTITVVFSEAVTAATATNSANYTLNNGTLPGSVTYSTATNTATITISGSSAALAAGDVIGVKAGVILTSDNRSVAPTSFTVVADTTKPTATIKAAQGSPATQDHIFVVFSEAVTTDFGDAARDFAFGDVTVTGVTVTGLTFISPTVYQVDLSAAPAVGATVTLATTWTDSANNAPAAQTQTTVASDVSGPSSVSLAKLTLSQQAASTRTIDGTGDVLITSLASGAAAGAAGNAWTVSVVDNNSALSVGVNASAKVITISTDLNNSNGQQTTATAVSAALNADSTFKTLFVSTVPNAGVFDANVAGSGSLANGLTAVTVQTTFAEAIDPDSLAGGDFNLDLNGDGLPEDAGADSVITTSSVSANTVIVTFVESSAAFIPAAGTAKIQVVLGSIQDIANNVNAALLTATLS